MNIKLALVLPDCEKITAINVKVSLKADVQTVKILQDHISVNNTHREKFVLY